MENANSASKPGERWSILNEQSKQAVKANKLIMQKIKHYCYICYVDNQYSWLTFSGHYALLIENRYTTYMKTSIRYMHVFYMNVNLVSAQPKALYIFSDTMT